VRDHAPFVNVRISGRLVDASPASVLPTATQLVAVAHDTPYKKLSCTPLTDGVFVTVHFPPLSVSISMVPVPPSAVLVKKYPTATQFPVLGQETEKR
jgi:hypothetical protein